MFTSDFLIAQLFGLFSFVLGALCFLQKNDQKFKYFMLGININHTIHFLLLGAFTSVLCSVVSVFRTAISIKSKSPILAYFFISLLLCLSFLWAERWYDWLCVIGACCGTYGLFCLSGIAMRLTMTVGSMFWLANNYMVGSIGGMMLETMVLAINTSTMLRIYRDKLALAALVKTHSNSDPINAPISNNLTAPL